jgi:hypothetical protein
MSTVYKFPYLFLLQRMKEEATTPDTTTNFGNNNSFSGQKDQFGPQIGSMSNAQKRVLNNFYVFI